MNGEQYFNYFYIKYKYQITVYQFQEIISKSFIKFLLSQILNIQLKLMSYNKCNCSVDSLSDLYVCSQAECMNPSIRCKQCFKKVHRYDDNRPKKTHPYSTFDASYLYKHFISLVKILQIMGKKMNRDFGGLKINNEYFTLMIFCSSEHFKDILSDQSVYNQFWILRQIYYKRPALFNESPSPQLVVALTRFSQKKYEQVKLALTKKTGEQQLLEYSFNMIADNNTFELQKFILHEQEVFIQYCDKMRDEGIKIFDIFAYMKERRKSDNKSMYYGRDFQNFLQQKYEQAPEDQQLFTLQEYTSYIWQEFHLISTVKKNQEYLQHWLQSYAVYSQYYRQSNLEESILSFRMWKHYASKYQQKQSLNNLYFLDCFIISYLDYLIDEKNYGLGFETSLKYEDYQKYLKDYAKFTSKNKQQYLSMPQYKKYYIFRKDCEKFLNHIKQSVDIVYNSKLAIQYLNNLYSKNSKASLKGYKQFIQQEQEKQVQKIVALDEKIKQLREELKYEYGQDKFYETIYDGYINVSLDQKLPISKDQYFLFRKQVLSKIDENQIRLENQMIKYRSENAQKFGKQGSEKMMTEEKNIQDEQMIEDAFEDSEAGEGEDQMIQLCLCCKGNVDSCQEEQCLAMGYCITCSL